jgi:hypothetical protein
MNKLNAGVCSLLLVGAAIPAAAQDRVLTRWLNPTDGSFLDPQSWTNGVPNNQPDLVFDVFIDQAGLPYVVSFDPSRFDNTTYRVQSLTLDSTDATFTLENGFDGGTFFVHEFVNLRGGTLELGQAGLIGSGGGIPMLVEPEASITIHPAVTDQRFAKLQGFDIHGGDVFIHGNDPLCFYNSSVVSGGLAIDGATIGVNTPVSYDIQLGRAIGESGILNTPISELEIMEGVQISGYGFQIQRFTEPFYGAGLGGTFLNRGLITSLGGESSIANVLNFGIIEVLDGVLQLPATNQGLMHASGSGELRHFVTNNGGLRTFNNEGVIEVDGADSRYVVSARYLYSHDITESFWSNNGIIRLLNGATAEIASASLDKLGTYEREPGTEIAITGPFDLGGGTLTSDSFHGPVMLRTSDDSYINSRPIIRNGTIDRPQGWLFHDGDDGALSNVTITGGDWIVDTADPSGGTLPHLYILNVQNVEVPEGDIVLSQGAHIRFGQLPNNGIELFMNETIRTLMPVGHRTAVSIAMGNTLELGPDARVSGAIDFGGGAYNGRSVLNRGLIEAQIGTGALRFECLLENENLVRAEFNDLELLDVVNAGTVSAWFGGIEARLFENAGLIEVRPFGWIHADSTLTLTPDSVIRVTPAANAPACVGSDFPITLDGQIVIDCSAIIEPGMYQLLSAPELSGRFDRVSVNGLNDEFEYGGINEQGWMTIRHARTTFGRGPIAR